MGCVAQPPETSEPATRRRSARLPEVFPAVHVPHRSEFVACVSWHWTCIYNTIDLYFYFVSIVVVANSCGSVVNQNNTYIQNANYPSAAPAGMCMYEIQKCSADICQYRFVFEDVVLSDPMMGDCTNDTIMFSGLDPPSMATVPPSLCGTLSGQESKILSHSVSIYLHDQIYQCMSW